jgi:hypothetical protein
LGYALIVVGGKLALTAGTVVGVAVGVVAGSLLWYFWPSIWFFGSLHPITGSIFIIGLLILASGSVFFRAGHTRLRPPGIRAGLLMGIAAGGSFLLYAWPYVECPIDLPPSAHNLYANSFGFWLAYHAAVRFDASVEDCLATADKTYRHYCDEFGRPYKPPVEIDTNRGKPCPRGAGESCVQTRDTDPKTGEPIGNWRETRIQSNDVERWLKDTRTIQKGFYWEGGSSWEPEFWVDTERGVFYMLLND